jgi:hypothetical protein
VRSTAIINLELLKIRKINDRRKQVKLKKNTKHEDKKGKSNKVLAKTTESIEILNIFLIIKFTVI